MLRPGLGRCEVRTAGGVAPEQIALTICLGSAVGTLPLLWGTTLLCAGLAARFKLNQIAMQAVNYLVYPVQIALFFPFFRMGERFVPWGPTVPPEMLREALQGRFLSTVTLLGWGTLKAMVVWLVIVPPSALLLYPLLVITLRRTGSRLRSHPCERRNHRQAAHHGGRGELSTQADPASKTLGPGKGCPLIYQGSQRKTPISLLSERGVFIAYLS
jgi:uncharacterized protein (DUF2062 family)